MELVTICYTLCKRLHIITSDRYIGCWLQEIPNNLHSEVLCGIPWKIEASKLCSNWMSLPQECVCGYSTFQRKREDLPLSRCCSQACNR